MFKNIQHKRFLGFLLISMVLACSPKQTFQKKTYTYSQCVNLPYTLSTAKSEKERKLLLILPDYKDSLNYTKSKLVEELMAENYQLLIPERRGADYSQKQIYDNLQSRFDHVVGLVNDLVAKDSVDITNRFVIYGSGEGAYFASLLLYELKPDYFILQNNGSTNFLDAVQNVLLQDEEKKLERIRQSTFWSAQQLNAFIKAVNGEGVVQDGFHGKSTGSWKSYSNLNVLGNLSLANPPGLQLTDSTYEYLATKNLREYENYLGKMPSVKPLEYQYPLFGRHKPNAALVEALEKVFAVELSLK